MSARREFYLVQRIKFSPLRKPEPGKELTPLQIIANSGGFGGGRLNDDFVLDYMGSSEFEWGAVPRAAKLFKEGGKLVRGEFEYGGHTLDFIWRDKDGEPFEDWVAWVEGGLRGKESSAELEYRLKGERPPWWRDESERPWETAMWWSLEDAVMWGFKEDGHVERFAG